MTDYLKDLANAGSSFLDAEGKKALNDLKNAVPNVPNIDLNVDIGNYDAMGNLVTSGVTAGVSIAASALPKPLAPKAAPPPAPHLIATPSPRKGHHPMIFKKSGTAPYPPHLESVAAAAPGEPSMVSAVEESAPVKFIKGMSPGAKIAAGVASAFGLVWLLKR